jgi:hypothetical protein
LRLLVPLAWSLALAAPLAACAPGDPLPIGEASTSTDSRDASSDATPDAGSSDASDASLDSGGDGGSTDAADASAPDADTTAFTVGEPLAATVDLLWTAPMRLAVPIETGEILAESNGELLRFVPGQGLPLYHGSAAGELRAAARVDGQTLVAGTGGVWVLEPGGLDPSPLGPSLGKTNLVESLLAVPGAGGDDLWIGAVKGLYRWRSGSLEPIVPGALPDRDALLAHGAPLDGSPALWVASGELIYALTEGADGLLAWPERDDLPASALAADSAGHLWAISEGALHQRTPDGVWHGVPVAEPATAVAARPDLPATWILDADGLLRHEAGVVRPGSKQPDGAERLLATPDGAAVVYGDDGIWIVLPGHLLTLAGIEDGQTVTSATVVSVTPTPPVGVVSVTATIDEAPADVQQDPWRVVLSPAALGDGPHTLAVTTTWEEGDPATATVGFVVETLPPPTWTEDIEPLYQQRCDTCHNPAVTKSPLDTYDLWKSRIDDILGAVTKGLMPLPPNPALTPTEVDRIQAWRDADFPK